MSGDPHTPRPLGGRYELGALLARGGMGEVWRARDLELGRTVAVKVVRDELAGDPVVAERFRREARAAGALNHPNVAAVYDFVDEGGRLAIVMEFVDGETLGERIAAEGALPIADVVEVADRLLAALDAAHTAGVVHRDVTPGNVMLAGDRVKVTDFGVAVVASEAATRLTDSGTVLGTAPYLAPEQLGGERPTPATDQYAAGLVLYEALTGRRPFDADHATASALARLTIEPDPVRVHRPDVPPALEGVVMRALSRDAVDRFPSVRAMRAALPLPGRTSDAGAATTAVHEVEERHPTTRPLPLVPTATGGPAGDGRRSRRDMGLAVALLGAGALVALAAFGAFGSGQATSGVPDFVGMSVAQAAAAAEDAGLDMGARSVDSDAPRGTVIAQGVPAGTEVAEGSSVVLEVSSGVPPCCVVPDVVGMAEHEARSTITAAGLAVGDVHRTPAPDDRGTTIGQEPVVGAGAEPGSPVVLVVSSGPPDDDDEDKDDDKGKGKGNRKNDD